MEAYKSGNGRVFSQRPQIRNRKCYGCGKLGHFVRDCPTKRRDNNSAKFEPHNQQRYYWDQQRYYLDQQPVTDVWTDGSMMSTLKPQNKCCHEIARKISASNLHEGFSSRLSDFCEDNSSSDSSEDNSSSTSASDSSEDYFSSASDSSEDHSSSVLSDSFAAYANQLGDYLSSAPETSSALHSSGVFSSSVSDSSQVSSSSASDSHTDKCEGEDINEFKDWEKIQSHQCGTWSIAERGSDGNHQFPICTGVDSPSQIIGQASKESLVSAECHKAVQSMHSLSMLLLINSSFSDNLSESDLQTLQSVICNLSQCLLKSRGISNPTDASAFKPDKQLVAANSGDTGKDCYAAGKKEDPVGTRSSQMSAKVYQSQMAKFEVELNLIKSEFRSLRAQLLKKAHAGTHENGDIETLANRDDAKNGNCPAMNLFMKENDSDYTCASFSEERSQSLPDLNMDPIMEDETFTGGCYLKKNEDNAISQNNISEEPIQKSSLSTIEDYFRIIRANIGNNLVYD